MESHCIYGPAPLLSALVDARRLTAARPPRSSGSPGSLLSNSSLKAQRQPKDIFKPIHLTSPVPFQQYHGAFFLVFFFFPSAEIMVHTSQAGGRLFTTITAAWPAVLFHSYLTTYIQPPSQENLSHWQLMQISIFSINKLKVHFLKSWKVLQFKETN